MRKLNKIIALLLAVMMVAALFAGCGEKKPAETTAAPETTAAAQSTTAAAEDTTAAAAEEVIELEFMQDSPVPLIEGGLSDQWLDFVEESCNVKITMNIPAASAYNDNLQLMMLDDDQPDAVVLPTNWSTMPSFTDACKNGMFVDISDMLPNYPNIMEYCYPVSWEALDVNKDGGIYGVPRTTMIRADGVFLNEQWLEAVGSDFTPGDYLTIDEVYDLAYKFTYEDPDGNGKDDTYGWSGYATEGVVATGLEGICGDSGAWMKQEDGSYMCANKDPDNPAYKNFLTLANKFWEAGLYDPDLFSLDVNKRQERMDANTYGMWGGFAGWLDVPERPNRPGNRTMVYSPGVVEHEGDKYYRTAFSTGIWCFWAIPSSCEHPEKVLEVLDFMLSDKGWESIVARGVEGIHYTIDENGNYDMTAKKAFLETLTNEDAKRSDIIERFVRRNTGADFFVSRDYSAETREKLEGYIQTACSNVVISADRGFKPDIANDSVFIEYQAYMNDEINKIIAGEKPIDYYDELLQGWYDAGGTQYVEQMNEYIKSVEG